MFESEILFSYPFLGLVILCIAIYEAVNITLYHRNKQPKYKLIGLSGKIGVGKDTAARYIMKQWPQYKSVPFADAVKRVVAIMTRTSYESQFTLEGKARIPPGCSESVGRYQQIIGQFGRENFCDNIWINIALGHPAEYKIIPDVRHPNEAEAICKAGGIVIRIIRDNSTPYSGRDPVHISETALDNYDFNNIINNSGSLESFESAILNMLL